MHCCCALTFASARLCCFILKLKYLVLEPCAGVILSAAARQVILTGGGGVPINFFRRRRRHLNVGGVWRRGCQEWRTWSIVLPFVSLHARHKYNENRRNQSNATSLIVYLMHYNQSIKHSGLFKWLAWVVRTTPSTQRVPSAILAERGWDIGLQGRLSLVMAPNAPWTILGEILLKVKF